MRQIDWTVWKPRLAYGGFAFLSFLVALRWTFPGEAVKERLILEAGVRGWQVDVERISAGGGLLGVTAKGVKLANDTGLAVPIDEVTASLRLLPLLAGRRSVAFDVRIYDGELRGTADLSGATRRVVAEAEDIDLAAALPLRKASGLDLLGRVAGTVELELPSAPAERASGRVEVQVKDAGIAGGQVPIPGMGAGFPLPRLAFGQVTAALQVGEGRATFQKLEAKGGDAELQADGVYFVVQPRLEFAPIFGKAKVKVADAFWTKSGTQGFKGLAEASLAQAKGADGAWSFNVTGSVGHPRFVPAAVQAR